MNIYLDMVGCRLNQSELEEMAQQFTAEGHHLTAAMKEADLAVVNTCTVTVAAAADSRKLIRRIARNGVENIVVTGCWSTMEPEMAASLPSVTNVVPNVDKNFLVSQLIAGSREKTLSAKKEQRRVPGSRERTRAFIKTQDGCNHQCAFCITTVARGSSRSKTMDDVIQQIQGLTYKGIKEAVLTGVQLGSWGRDLPGSVRLSDLVSEIIQQTQLPRLRLSSIEPWDVTPQLVGLLQSDRIARHLHLPLQSGSKRTLTRMNRAFSPLRYQNLINEIRNEIPEIAITTDIIVGFPGETEDEFEASKLFIQSMQFAGGHVFTYSARPDTLAANYPDQVPHPIRKNRSAQIRKLLADEAEKYRRQFVGHQLWVLWEDVNVNKDGSGIAQGLTDNYIRVETHTNRDIWNTITSTKLLKTTSKGLYGKVVKR